MIITGGEIEKKKIKPGYKTGKLTVVGSTEQRKNNYIIWRCRCECGGEINLDTRTLQRESIRDCGCLTKVKPRQRDITGQRFGSLVAMEPVGTSPGKRSVIWRCKCDCGGEVNASLSQLRAGYRKSCGCRGWRNRKSLIGKRFGKLKVISCSGKKQNRVYYWSCECECGNTVEVRQDYLLSGKTKSCGCLNKEILRDRLRLVDGTSITILESVNSRLRKNNTSGYTGIYLSKKNKWVAEISFKGERYYLGSYEKKSDAIKARLRGEEKHIEFLKEMGC